MPSGIIKQISGLAAPVDSNHLLVVTATFEASGFSGGDWGSAYRARLFKIQGGSTVNGDEIPLSSARLPYAIQYTFSLVSGQAIDCGLYGVLSGAVAATYWNIKLQAEIIKR